MGEPRNKAGRVFCAQIQAAPTVALLHQLACKEIRVHPMGFFLGALSRFAYEGH